LLLFLLIIVSVGRHPSSIQSGGSGLLIMDIALVLGYGAFSAWAWRQRRAEVRNALIAGAQSI
jgi:hypothetical protein